MFFILKIELGFRTTKYKFIVWNCEESSDMILK